MDVKKAAKAILERINTAEKAIALKGEERAKYLDALDKVFGPKKERAEALGYDLTQKLYHGSPNKPFEQFLSSKAKSTSGHSSAELGTWVTPEREVAENYLYKNGKKTKEGHIRELVGRFDNPQEVPFSQLSSYEAEYLPTEDIKRYLKNKPDIDALTIKGSPGETLYTNPQGVSDVTLVRTPEKLRDINAAFDPRFKDSPYLMSAVGGAKNASSLTNPAELVEKAYGTYTKGVGDVAKKIADKIYEQTSGKLLSKEQQEQDPAKDVLEVGTEMAIDPLSYVGPGEVKAAGKAAEKSKALLQIAKRLRGK